jgi:hypothetical protein
MLAKVSSISGARVRAEPNGEQLYSLPYGAKVEVDNVTDGWAKVAIMAGGAVVNFPRSITPVFAYVATSTLDFGTTPTPQPSGNMRLGLHLLGPASDQSGRIGEAAFAQGCRVFTIIDDELFAVKLADMGARVFFRWWTNNSAIRPSDLAGRVRSFCQHPNIVTLGLNEGDLIGCWTAEEMNRRGQWDTEAFNLITAQGGKYAGYGCAMGNPSDDEATYAALSKWYAPLWKAGMLFNYHSYSPSFTKPFESYDWYEGRWRFWFTRAGFDAANPGKAEVIGDETGVDVMGTGGFAAFNATDEQVNAWCVKHYEAQSKPLVVNGKSYPSPFTDATLFQSSMSLRWAGYNVRPAGVKWVK